MPSADLLVLDPERATAGPFPLPRPLLYLVEALTDLGGHRAAQRDTERLPRLPGREPSEQRA
jgi:hypothetical protein